MSAEYEVHIYDASGIRMAVVDNFVDDDGASLAYTRAVNTISKAGLSLGSQYAYLFKSPSRWVDSRIEIWRKPAGGASYLDTETCFLTRSLRKRIRGGIKTFQIGAVSANQLLKRAVVAALDETAAAKKTAAIDNMMKAIVREQLGASAAGIRNRSAYLSVEADLTLGTSTTKAFSYDNVLSVLQDLAKEAGTTVSPLFFDIVALDRNLLQFQVRRGQWGSDRTTGTGGQKAVLLSAEDDTLTDVAIDYDYENEVNYVYVGGAGQDSGQIVEPVFDAARYNLTVLNLHEAYTSYGNSNVTAVLQSAGYAALREGRPKKIMTATLQETSRFRYGLEWFFGDKLTASVDDEQFDCRVDAVSVSMQAGTEQVLANLRGET